MCTVISDNEKRHIFARTLDLEYSYGVEVVIAPRGLRLEFLHLPPSDEHYAILGAARVEGTTPLFFDAVNEVGLCAAALNFPRFTEYRRAVEGVHNVASFEVITWVLSRAKSVEEAHRLLSSSNITDESFSPELPSTPLHWIFSDSDSSITVESTCRGLEIHENPLGVLTNSPDFSAQLTNLERYHHIIHGTGATNATLHSRGLDGVGIPGDYSSSSRFVRAVYAKERTRGNPAENAVSRAFHLMETVSQPKGITRSEDGRAVCTVYTAVIDSASKKYYFTTYENRRIRCVKLDTGSTFGDALLRFSMYSEEEI